MSYSILSKILGFAKEAVRGTAETTITKYIPIDKDSEFDYKPTLIPDEKMRGVLDEFAPMVGQKTGTGKISFDVDSDNCGEMLLSAIGSVTSDEQHVITIAATNKFFDFDIGATELVATIAEATYPIGTIQTEAGSFCKALYDAIHAAEAVGTYTVTYSRTTKKITVARDAGGTLTWLLKTGTHGSDNLDTHCGTVMGFADTADLSSAITYTGTVNVQDCFKHTFIRSTGLSPQAYTFFMDRGLNKLSYSLGVAKAIELSGDMTNALKLSADIIFKTEATSVATFTPTWAEPAPFMFHQTAFTLASTPNTDIRKYSVKIDNQAIAKWCFIGDGSSDLTDIITPAVLKVSGSFEIYFENATERAKFLAATSSALVVTLTGAVINGTFYKKLVITIPKMIYTAFPYGELDGLLGASVAFEGKYNLGGSPLSSLQVELYNQTAAY